MEPWLQKAVHDKLLIEKSTRVRSSDGSKVAKAVGYTCAKDSCGMLFPLGVSKQQYNRHLRDAAAHRTSNFAFGTSVPACRAASSSSNGQRPAEFRPWYHRGRGRALGVHRKPGRPVRLGRGSLVLEVDRVRRLEHVPPHCSVRA